MTKAAKRAAKQQGIDLNPGPKAKAKAEPKGGGGGDQSGANAGKSKGGGKGGGSDKKKILCKYVKNPNLGKCPCGKKNCDYSHNKRFFDEKGNWIGRPKKKKEGWRPTGRRRRDRGRLGHASWSPRFWTSSCYQRKRPLGHPNGPNQSQLSESCLVPAASALIRLRVKELRKPMVQLNHTLNHEGVESS